MTYTSHFKEILNKFVSSKDDNNIDEFRMAFHEFQDKIEETVLDKKLKRNKRYNELRGGAQSRQFMIQILPFVREYMRSFEQGSCFDILDVGPGTGFGSNLLAALYQTVQLGYRARVVTADVDPDYIDFMKIFCRYVVPKHIDIADIDRTFDIVIASHVIEHVIEWKVFLERLCALSTGIVIICSPYDECADELTMGHVNIFNDQVLSEFGAVRIELMESPAWGNFRSPPYKMFVAVLRGGAKKKSLSG